MRRVFFAAGVLVLGLATLMWATATISAPHGGGGHVGGGGGGHVGGGGGGHVGSGGGHVGGGGGGHVGGVGAAHIGSVHYGDRTAAAQFGPTARAGAVRSEHYAGVASRGGYRNPYRDDYFRHFRPGYLPFVIDDAQYYGYDNLPPGYQQVVVNGIIYYLFDGVYYQPYIYGGQTVYLVVPNPTTPG